MSDTILPSSSLENASMLEIPSTAGQFERLPKWLNLIPMIVQWLWLSMQYRSISLPSCANPHITSGGMVGDGKLEYFSTMGKLAHSCTAGFISFKATKNFNTENALEQMRQSGLNFPIVVKPDLGWCGYGVRLLSTPEDLLDYALHYPENETFLLQAFIPFEGEAGIFYARHPDETEGKILGILLRFYPKVIGDGYSSIRELITADFRLHRLVNNKLHQCSFDPNYIPNEGETVRLSLIGSTRVGGLYMDGSQHITTALTKKVDAIAKDMKAFHIGRFDVRYETMQKLCEGDFSIMEVNGSGSEAVHAWDPKYTIREVYKIVFAKQRVLFAISQACRELGHKPIGIFQLAKLHFHQQKNYEPLPALELAGFIVFTY